MSGTFLIAGVQMDQNLTAMMTLLPARDFVIFMELFSLILGFYLILAYLAYEGVSKVFRGVIFAFTFLYFSYPSDPLSLLGEHRERERHQDT